MAKYVLVEFDTDEEADAFVVTLKGTVEHLVPTDSPNSIRVVGTYKKPTKFCECPNPGDKSVLGTKWGWWVHSVCGKPKKGNWQSPRNLIDTRNIKPSQRKLMINLVEPRVLDGTSP